MGTSQARESGRVSEGFGSIQEPLQHIPRFVGRTGRQNAGEKLTRRSSTRRRASQDSAALSPNHTQRLRSLRAPVSGKGVFQGAAPEDGGGCSGTAKPD